MYPYVGKNVANLTLAQIKTLDCGSLRIDGFPFSGTSEHLAVRPVLYPLILRLAPSEAHEWLRGAVETK